MNLWKTKLFTYNISANTFHTNLKVRFFQETFATDQFLVASSRRWVSQGTVQKTAREKIKKNARGHNERPSWSVEHNRSRSNRNAYPLRNREEPESTRLCIKISKNGSWHLYICRSVFGILTFCFAEFDTSVICHAVLMLCLGSFLLKNMF